MTQVIPLQMGRQVSALIALLVGLMLAVAVPANAQDQQALIPSPPKVGASSYILMDARSGRVIVEENSDERLPPASLTKMMTAYIVERELDEERIAMKDQVPISVNAWKTGGSRMFVQEGTKVSVKKLLKGVIIQSGNDASVALAEFIAGSEDAFADIMNQQARQLGMENSRFQNATGLPEDNHYASARDLALLAKAIISDYPDRYSVYSEKYFTYNDIRQPNRNSLLWRDPSVDGLKTGHTEAAGYCLVASAKREGMRLIAVVMGTSSERARAQEVQKLLNYGFRYYETHKVLSAGQSLEQTRVWGGQADQLNLGVSDDAIVTIPRDSKDKLEYMMDIDTVIKAPVQAGDELGEVRVKLDGEVIVREPVVALESVPEGGLFKRLWDAIKLFFMQLFN